MICYHIPHAILKSGLDLIGPEDTQLCDRKITQPSKLGPLKIRPPFRMKPYMLYPQRQFSFFKQQSKVTLMLPYLIPDNKESCNNSLPILFMKPPLQQTIK